MSNPGSLFLRPLFDWRSAVASRLGPEKPTTRHVLLTLSLHMNVKGDSCWPSIDRLAEESGLSRRAVVEHLRLAAETGWIGKQERLGRNGQGWRRMEYFSMIPRGIEESLKKGGDAGAPPKGGDFHAEGGDFHDTKVVTDVHLSTSMRTSRGRKPSKGDDAPSATTECWKVYAEGQKRLYGVEPPRNAKANGQLAQLVARVGAEHAARLVGFYMAHTGQYYRQVNHSLDALLKDSTPKLWNEMHKTLGGAAAQTAPTTAEIAFTYPNGSTRKLEDAPIGDPEQIAKKAIRSYGRMVSQSNPKNVVVTIGPQAHTYSVAELSRGATG